MQQSTTILNGSILLYEVGTESLYIMQSRFKLYVHCIILWSVCRNNFTCTKRILLTLSILQPWIYSLIIQRIIWKRHDNNYEDSLLMVRVVCLNMPENL